MWRGETAERASTRVQQRVLVSSARVGVTARNVFLRSAGTGKLSDGTPVSKLATATEFGRPSAAPIKSRSKLGTPYTRRTGDTFGPRNRKGNVVYPAARASIRRMASLWIQTAIRSLYEAEKKV